MPDAGRVVTGSAGGLRLEAPGSGTRPLSDKVKQALFSMLEAEREWLPQFDGKHIRPAPTISIPPDCKPVDVPLDPALAINKRFGTLIQQETE